MTQAAHLSGRYQRGGDIYLKLAAQYGPAGADLVAQADRTSKQGAIAEALATLKHGPAPETDPVKIFNERIKSGILYVLRKVNQSS